jgi:heme oxygenase (mycobilin-producing)
MSVVKLNAVYVPRERAAEFEERFRRRAGQVAGAEGFEAFELLRPGEGERYLVYTRWASEEAFQAWTSSPAFQHGHRAHSTEGPISSRSELWDYEVVQAEYA